MLVQRAVDGDAAFRTTVDQEQASIETQERALESAAGPGAPEPQPAKRDATGAFAVVAFSEPIAFAGCGEDPNKVLGIPDREAPLVERVPVADEGCFGLPAELTRGRGRASGKAGGESEAGERGGEPHGEVRGGAGGVLELTHAEFGLFELFCRLRAAST
jgi:hypothetical protein